MRSAKAVFLAAQHSYICYFVFLSFLFVLISDFPLVQLSVDKAARIFQCSCFYMELRFGERHIKVNTLIALIGFLSKRLDLATPTTSM